jgi:hypothetical protein
MNKLLKFTRESSGKLILYIHDDGNWVRYNNHSSYVKDFKISSQSGFATAQKLLSLGYQYVKSDE